MLKKEFLVAFAVSVAIAGANFFILLIRVIMFDTVSSSQAEAYIKDAIVSNFIIFSVVPAIAYYFLHIKKAIKNLTPKLSFVFLTSLLFLPLCMHILAFTFNEWEANCYGAKRFEDNNSIFKNFCENVDYSNDYNDDL